MLSYLGRIESITRHLHHLLRNSILEQDMITLELSVESFELQRVCHHLRSPPFVSKNGPLRGPATLLLSSQDLAQEILGPVFFGIVKDFLRATFFNDDSAIHEDDTVSYFLGKAHFVGDDNHGHTRFS